MDNGREKAIDIKNQPRLLLIRRMWGSHAVRKILLSTRMTVSN